MAKTPKEKAQPDEEIEEIIRNVADRLAAARKARGLSQAALGAMADMTQQQIFGLEQGTVNVTIRTLARIAKALDVDLQTLFSELGPSTESRLVGALDQVTRLIAERSLQDKAFGALFEERALQEQIFLTKVSQFIDNTKGLSERPSSDEAAAIGKPPNEGPKDAE